MTQNEVVPLHGADSVRRPALVAPASTSAGLPMTAARPPDAPVRLPGFLLRRGIPPYLLLGDLATFAFATAVTSAMLWPHHVGLLVGTVLVLGQAGLYRSRLTLSALDDLPRLLGGVGVGSVVSILLFLFAGSPVPLQNVLLHGAAFAGSLLASRALAYAVVRAARRRGVVGHRVLVLGAGRVGARLAAAMHDHPEYGLRPVGFLDPEPLLPADELPAPLLGDYGDLAATLLRHDIGDVIVAFGGMRESSLVDVLRTCDRLQCEIFVVPRLFELHHRSRDMDEVWGIPLARVRRPTWRNASWRLKRVLDVVVSAACLLLLSPLLAVIALLVRREGGRGVIFRQLRVGLDGQPFTLLKFRSIRPMDDVESATRWSVAEDVRIGRVGRFLRATSLDELPQLVNVLRGDMSIVGPRPERPHFVAQFTDAIPRYPARHRTPAGLTGWAQVHGLRGDTSIEERASFDNYYIQNWSLWLDAKILLRTVATPFLRRGT